MGKKMFILYDGRAMSGDLDDASVMDTAETEEEAADTGRTTWAGHDAIWYEYHQQGDKLVNGKPRHDLPPRGG